MMIDILKHGAIPDGKADCTAALQAALRDSHASGEPIVFPAGDFRFGRAANLKGDSK